MLSSCRCSLKNRLVIIPADLELSCAKPNAYLYWQWAFESPQNVKLLVRQELGEDNAPQVCLLWLCCTRHIADTVAVMYLGRVVERAPAEQLFHQARHPYTRALLASVLTAEPGLGIPDVGLGDAIPDPAAIPPGCRFHPRCPVAIPGRCNVETPSQWQSKGQMAECLLASD